jgi:NitT/TauT family transport system permease protein
LTDVIGDETTSQKLKESRKRDVVSKRIYQYLPAIFLFISGVAVWEILVRGFNIQQFLLPPPSVIVSAFFDTYVDLKVATFQTFYEAVGGFIIGTILAIIVSLVTFRWAVARRAIMPFAIAVAAIPSIILAPIFNNWFGSTNPLSKMSIVVILVFFPIVIHSIRGLKQVDPRALELMYSYGASEFSILLKLRIPNAMPYFFTALKISSTLALIGAIVAEYFGGVLRSLGVWILNTANQFRFPIAWAGILAACLMGITFYLIIIFLERLVIPWHSSMRGSER